MHGYRFFSCFFLVSTLFGVSLKVAASSADNMNSNIYEDMAGSFAWIKPGQGAGSPAGKFLLIRNGKDICAIRFISFHRDHDAKPETFFSSGEENAFGEYQWLYQGDGSNSLDNKDVTSGIGRLRHGPSVMLGHGITLKRPSGGTPWVACGPFKFGWSYPVGLSFWSYASGSHSRWDTETEFAPTNWTNANEINLGNSKLRWVNGVENGTQKIEWLSEDKLP